MSKNVKLFGNSKNSKHTATRGKRADKPKKAVTGGKKKKIAVIAACTAGVLAAGVLGVGAYAAGGDTVHNNVYFDGIDMSDMTREQVVAALEEAGYENANKTVTVNFYGGDYEIDTLEITSEDANLAMSVESAADMIMDYGRGNIVTGAFQFMRCMTGKNEIDREKKFDNSAVKGIISDEAENLNSEYAENKYIVKENEIEITKGAGDRTVNEDEVFEMVKRAFDNEDFEPIKCDISKREPERIDFKAINDEVYIEPQNATFDKEIADVVEGVAGICLNVEEAEKLYKEAKVGDTFTIPFEEVKPDIDAAAMKEMLFKDVLAVKETPLTSHKGRTKNIELASNEINGLVLNPGDEFSFNGVVGERTPERGYQIAGVYSGGRLANDYGGGICQIASTIYYCVQLSDLQIVDRSNHMFPVHYLPIGLDATVNWGTVDFKFANNHNYPIKMVAYVVGDNLHIEILGTKENDHTFELSSQIIETRGYKTIEKVSDSVTTRTVEVSGNKGYVVDSFRTEYDGNGNKLQTIHLYRDTFRTCDEVVLVPPSGSGSSGGSSEGGSSSDSSSSEDGSESGGGEDNNPDSENV